ncbi:HEPN domain-containing protein [Rahnella inusitata]|uniref:HEPN domain-containing protein n=1 Tax=Rahnella inusitata TaxID=58169 RepID=UPI0039BEBC44
MTPNIINQTAKKSLVQCYDDLTKIDTIIKKDGGGATHVPFLTRYAIIKSCGTIEFCFKTIVSDHTSQTINEQVKRFIDGKFRNSSMNPSLHNIRNGLASFDTKWCTDFENAVKTHPNHEKIKLSLASLNTARNHFAHGDSITVSFANVFKYFLDSVTIIELMEATILSIEMDEATEGDA